MELRCQEEDISACVGSQSVQMLQYGGPDALGRTIHYEMHIYIDGRTPLIGFQQVSRREWKGGNTMFRGI